jgi:CxxC motif-containing protein (DUF1111 family)
VGNSFFRRNWVEAPSSTAARDGLGPHFLARSCGGCHDQDGRGRPPELRRGLSSGDDNTLGLLIRLSVPGPGGVPLPDPVYGDQFNDRAIQGVRPEGRLQIRSRPLQGRFADGQRFTLQQPDYRLTHLGYGPLAAGAMLSPRVAPQLSGVGFLEAIADADILDNARQQAQAGGPVHGVPNRVADRATGQIRIGRFGWKANVATLMHQTAGAFVGDMGITSSLFPNETCTPAQRDCLAAPRGGAGGSPEIDDKTLRDVVFYQSALAPAARRQASDPVVLQGQKLFHAAQCASCHRPSYTTAEPPFPSLSSTRLGGQRIWPYTDLLLHDMGPGLADGRPDGQASGRQWKTPPLWGVGLIREVNGHQRLLHDGRAEGVLEAVLWHGGEAEGSRRQVLGFSAAEREALVRFVESL